MNELIPELGSCQKSHSRDEIFIWKWDALSSFDNPRSVHLRLVNYSQTLTPRTHLHPHLHAHTHTGRGKGRKNERRIRTDTHTFQKLHKLCSIKLFSAKSNRTLSLGLNCFWRFFAFPEFFWRDNSVARMCGTQICRHSFNPIKKRFQFAKYHYLITER